MREGFLPAAFSVLLVAAAAPGLAAGVDWPHARRVDDVAAEYKFSPDHLVFRTGATYRLHLVNRGKETHEFHAPEFFAAMELREGAPLNADHTEIVLQPGERKDLYFVARRAGHFPLTCSDHDWAGMTGDIEVK